MAENTEQERKSNQPGPSTDHGIEITVGIARLRAIKEEGSLGNRKISEMLGGISPGLISAWLNGQKRPLGEHRTKIRKAFGIPETDFDRVFRDVPAADEAPPATADIPPDAKRALDNPDDPTALELLRKTLERINKKLEASDLTVADQARLLSTSVQIINGIGRATGEMDQSDMQRFRQSVEYRSFVRRVVAVVADCPKCREGMLRVLGVASTEATAMSLSGALSPTELEGACNCVSNYAVFDDLALAVDLIQYPISGRERELVQLNRGLAQRCLSALELGHPILATSRIAYPPADEHREKLIRVLRDEINREERFVAFERDFGRIACDRARELAT